MLAELARPCSATWCRPTLVPLGLARQPPAPSALAAARAYAAQLDPGEHAVDPRRPDHRAHLAQPAADDCFHSGSMIAPNRAGGLIVS